MAANTQARDPYGLIAEFQNSSPPPKAPAAGSLKNKASNAAKGQPEKRINGFSDGLNRQLSFTSILTLYLGEVMKTIVLISCSKKKPRPNNWQNCYTKKPSFSKSLRYAKEVVQADEIFILSALHGLVELDRELEPLQCYVAEG